MATDMGKVDDDDVITNDEKWNGKLFEEYKRSE